MTAEVKKLLETALAHHNAGRLAEAEPIYRRVLAIDPREPDALHLLGLLAEQTGHLDAALSLLQQAAAQRPQIARFHRHVGEVLARLNRHREAAAALSQAIRLDPKDAHAHAVAGISLIELGQAPQATAELRAAMALRPREAVIAANLAGGLARVGLVKEAFEAVERVNRADPELGTAWCQLAAGLFQAGKWEEAVAPARRGVQLKPDDPRLHIVLGNALQTTAQFEEAAEEYRRALKLDPNNFDATSNLGLTLAKMGELDEATKIYESAMQRWPQAEQLRANRSLAYLTLGDLTRGFEEYEWRWKSQSFANYGRLPQPRWEGEPLEGKTIVLTTEQGMGDAIQFIRYAPLVAARGAKVLVSCPPDVQPLIETVEGVASVVGPTTPVPRIDFHAPLLSLPRVFRTTVETIPANVPYLRASEELVQRWRRRLDDDPKFKVGLVWAGSPSHQNDRARSCRLQDMQPLAALSDGVTFYSLQKGEASKQASARNDLKVIALDDELKTFSETAAVIENLDLLISVDTSVVHLAGALGRPVWTVLARGPDWRWMLNRSDSPWYPTMRLFRQQRLREWRAVFEEVTEELRRLVESRREDSV